VTVQLSTLDGWVEVAVTDRGPGLTETEADRVFDRGVRGAASGGSGLGLYVARTLMRRHGGDVELRSRVGGASFVVVLPVVERRTPDRPRRARTGASA
jgi:two-component system OmpR family sensor kinase